MYFVIRNDCLCDTFNTIFLKIILHKMQESMEKMKRKIINLDIAQRDEKNGGKKTSFIRLGGGLCCIKIRITRLSTDSEQRYWFTVVTR